MFRRSVFGAAVAVAVSAMLLLPAASPAQVVQLQGGAGVGYYNHGNNYPSGYYFGYGNTSPAYVVTAPTYLTSINYPLVYGAYSTFPYVGSSYAQSALVSPFSAIPTSPAVVVIANPQVPPAVTTPEMTATLSARPSALTTITSELPAGVRASATSAVINIRVPDDAEVRIQGRKMNENGAERQFVSPALNPGQTYSYDISARWNENGKPITQNQRVIVRAGERTGVTFIGRSQRERDREATLHTAEPR